MREIRTLRCDVEGTGNVAWSRYCDTRRRKSELTVNTNFDLNRRASPRPYLREAGGAIPSAYSPNLRKTAPRCDLCQSCQFATHRYQYLKTLTIIASRCSKFHNEGNFSCDPLCVPKTLNPAIVVMKS